MHVWDRVKTNELCRQFLVFTVTPNVYKGRKNMKGKRQDLTACSQIEISYSYRGKDGSCFIRIIAVVFLVVALFHRTVFDYLI